MVSGVGGGNRCTLVSTNKPVTVYVNNIDHLTVTFMLRPDDTSHPAHACRPNAIKTGPPAYVLFAGATQKLLSNHLRTVIKT